MQQLSLWIGWNEVLNMLSVCWAPNKLIQSSQPPVTSDTCFLQQSGVQYKTQLSTRTKIINTRSWKRSPLFCGERHMMFCVQVNMKKIRCYKTLNNHRTRWLLCPQGNSREIISYLLCTPTCTPQMVELIYHFETAYVKWNLLF